MKPGCWNIVPIKAKYSGTFSRRIKDAFVLSSWPNSFTKLSWNTTKMNPRHGRNGRNSELGTKTKKRRRNNKEKDPKKHRRRRRRCYDYERKRYFVRDVTLGRDGLSKQDPERIIRILLLPPVLPAAAAGTTNTFSHRDKNDFVPSKWHKSFTNTSSIATETKQGPGRSSKTPNANQR